MINVSRGTEKNTLSDSPTELSKRIRVLTLPKKLDSTAASDTGLTKVPEDYTLGEILRLTEGSLAPVACTEEGEHDCPRKESCPSHPVWQKLDHMINEFFDGITLADLIQPTSDKAEKDTAK